MNTIIKLEDIEAEVVHKNIRNIHLRVLPPDGKVFISAPFRTTTETIYKFASSQLSWIKKKRRINCHQVKQNYMINRYEVTNRKILSLKHIYNLI